MREDDEAGEIPRLETEETGKHFDEGAEEIRASPHLENLGDLCAESGQTLQASFSAVSKWILTNKN